MFYSVVESMGSCEDHSLAPLWSQWATLEGRDVRVQTRVPGQGSTCYDGLLLCIDPETLTSALLSLPGPKLRLVLGHAIADVSATGKETPPAVLDAGKEILAVAVRQRETSGTTKGSSECQKALAVLQQMRIPAELQENCVGGAPAINVMNGAARILPPFGPLNCESSNETVLLRLQCILREQHSPIP